MKRTRQFFMRVGRFFWSARFLKIALWTVTVIVFFYVEEDWRGARRWAETKAKWEARGETLDYARFTPAPVPESENLGAFPLFRTEKMGGKGGSSYLDCVTLRKALQVWEGPEFPATGGWMWRESPNLNRIRTAVAAEYAKVFRRAPLSPSANAQLEALYPFLPDLREEAQRCSYCRFDYDADQPMPWSRALALITSQIELSRVLTLHALLALDEHRPDLALADYRTIALLSEGAKNDPSLVGGLVGLGLFAISNAIVYDGLATHAWNDEQLTTIERSLNQVNFLATFQFDMRADAAGIAANLDYFKQHPADLGLGLEMAEGMTPHLPLARVYDRCCGEAYALWPSGWLDGNKVSLVNFQLDEVTSLDTRAQLAYPAANDRIRGQVDRARKSFAGYFPWTVLFTVLAPSSENAEMKFAFQQTRVDETRLACALERYGLAHHAYPASLAALVPGCIDVLPHDIMNGQPYHYRLRPDGTFLLYSVGWNQADDGGQALFTQPVNSLGHPSIDYEHGDWVWPAPK